MVETRRGVDLEPQAGFQSFVFPKLADANITDPDLANFLQSLNCRSTDHKRGERGYVESDESRLNGKIVEDLILTVRPHAVLWIDPDKDDRAAKVSGRIQSRDDGRLLPASIGIFTLTPEQTNSHILASKTAREPLNTIGIFPIPGYVGTIMEDLDGIIVSTQEVLDSWKPLYPEKKWFLFDKNNPDSAREFIENTISEHGKPKKEDWDKKTTGWARFRRNVTGRFGKRI